MALLESNEAYSCFLCLRDSPYLIHQWTILVATLVQIRSYFNCILKNCTGTAFSRSALVLDLLSVLVLGICVWNHLQFWFNFLTEKSLKSDSHHSFNFSFQWLWIKHNVRGGGGKLLLSTSEVYKANIEYSVWLSACKNHSKASRKVKRWNTLARYGIFEMPQTGNYCRILHPYKESFCSSPRFIFSLWQSAYLEMTMFAVA